MSEAPERIWVERDPDTGEKRWFSIKGMGDTEYVRADKLEELAAALRIAQGNTDAAIEDYNEAQAALAEKDKEIAALREECGFLQEILDARPAINAALPESYIRWSQSLYSGEAVRASLKARNAGGNDA